MSNWRFGRSMSCPDGISFDDITGIFGGPDHPTDIDDGSVPNGCGYFRSDGTIFFKKEGIWEEMATKAELPSISFFVDGIDDTPEIPILLNKFLVELADGNTVEVPL